MPFKDNEHVKSCSKTTGLESFNLTLSGPSIHPGKNLLKNTCTAQFQNTAKDPQSTVFPLNKLILLSLPITGAMRHKIKCLLQTRAPLLSPAITSFWTERQFFYEQQQNKKTKRENSHAEAHGNSLEWLCWVSPSNCSKQDNLTNSVTTLITM